METSPTIIYQDVSSESQSATSTIKALLELQQTTGMNSHAQLMKHVFSRDGLCWNTPLLYSFSSSGLVCNHCSLRYLSEYDL